jgi:exonuclease V gamma subunit
MSMLYGSNLDLSLSDLEQMLLSPEFKFLPSGEQAKLTIVLSKVKQFQDYIASAPYFKDLPEKVIEDINKLIKECHNIVDDVLCNYFQSRLN